MIPNVAQTSSLGGAYTSWHSLRLCILLALCLCGLAAPISASSTSAANAPSVSTSSASSISHAASQEVAVLLVSPSVLEDLPEFLNGDAIADVQDFNRPHTRRDLVDYILMRQALALGAEQPLTIEVKPWLSISYNRVLTSLARGKVTALSNTLWREDIQHDSPNLYISSPTLASGYYQVGLYTSPNNPKRLTTKTLKDVQQLTAISSRQWRPDWQALESLNLKRLESSVNWENMVKMVHRQRADFMLAPFTPEPDMSYSAMGVTLKPIPGLKVALKGSRGWAISRTHPAGKRFYQTLERGMQILKERGSFMHAYRQAGLLHAGTDDWLLLNP